MSDPLHKARAALEAWKASNPPPPERLDPLEKARRAPKSLRKAVNAMCWDCQGAGADPAPRWRIGNCAAPECPLYPVRPYQRLLDAPKPVSVA